MQVRRITLRDFRNYARAEVVLEKGVTVLQGPVGAGKTNLLEAIYFGCVGRSFRTSNDRELIRFGASSTHVAVETRTVGSDHVLEAGLERPARKVLKLDEASNKKAMDYLQNSKSDSMKVKVSGTVTGDSIAVESIEPGA